MSEQIIGLVSGKLTVVSHVERSLYLCRCECGGEKVVARYDLNSGEVKTCGCSNKGRTKHGLKNTPEYSIWRGIKTRCYNPNDKKYHRYGGRGIVMCDAWLDPVVFCQFVRENRKSPDLQIDRIDNDKGYSPENCRFVTNYENNAIGRRGISNRNTTGYVGVSFDSRRKDYASEVIHKGQRYRAYRFKTALAAHEWREAKLIELGIPQMNRLNRILSLV